MSGQIQYVRDWREAEETSVIDVRAGVEYSADHIPGAIHLPVLSDSERAEVGTLYKQQSSFTARIRGASLISANIAQHLTETLAHKPGDWRALIYCARGGLRSASMATVLQHVGWRISVLEGGYKSFRRTVMAETKQLTEEQPFVVVQGKTGTGKTHLLRAMEQVGGQVLDLEKLAAHRGSLLGAEPDEQQPQQRLFESRIHACLSSFDRERPVFVEAESSRVGEVQIPSGLWSAMRQAVRVEVEVPMGERVSFLVRDYAHLTSSPQKVQPLIEGMKSRHSKEILDRWSSALAEEDWNSLVEDFLVVHYDPAYGRTARQRSGKCLARISIDKLDESQVKAGAEKILQMESALLQAGRLAAGE